MALTDRNNEFKPQFVMQDQYRELEIGDDVEYQVFQAIPLIECFAYIFRYRTRAGKEKAIIFHALNGQFYDRHTSAANRLIKAIASRINEEADLSDVRISIATPAYPDAEPQLSRNKTAYQREQGIVTTAREVLTTLGFTQASTSVNVVSGCGTYCIDTDGQENVRYTELHSAHQRRVGAQTPTVVTEQQPTNKGWSKGASGFVAGLAAVFGGFFYGAYKQCRDLTGSRVLGVVFGSIWACTGIGTLFGMRRCFNDTYDHLRGATETSSVPPVLQISAPDSPSRTANAESQNTGSTVRASLIHDRLHVRPNTTASTANGNDTNPSSEFKTANPTSTPTSGYDANHFSEFRTANPISTDVDANAPSLTRRRSGGEQ